MSDMLQLVVGRGWTQAASFEVDHSLIALARGPWR